MKARLEDKNKAIELRRQGLSYKEIQAIVPVSKGLLSGWFEHLVLTPEEEKRLKIKIEERKKRGVMNSKILNQTRMLERERNVLKEAQVSFKKWKQDPLFIIGSTLFWSGGVKSSKNFDISSKDTDFIFFMYTWIQKYLQVSKEIIRINLFLYENQNSSGIKSFWTKNLGIKEDSIKVILQKGKIEAGANDQYNKGCIRLYITRVRYGSLMKAWQKLLVDYYGKALLGRK